MVDTEKKGLTYKDTGVDIDAGAEVVELIKKSVHSTSRPGVLTDIGGFGGLFALNKEGYKEPVLVSGTDGVGTKLKIAHALDVHNTVGIDLVAMCVNDILVQGAEPLFFLDYFATGALEPRKAADVIEGIAEGCRQAGCALLGGETAEMPGFYGTGEYDLAGFAVGIVDREDIITGHDIKEGDVILGLASSGLHSNGYSLVRKLVANAGLSLDTTYLDGSSRLGEELLRPTRIYVKSILALIKAYHVKGLAHITGGGLTHNVPRILPASVDAAIKLGSWPVPPIFEFIKREGGVSQEEMRQTFNMGIGMVVVLDAGLADEAAELLSKAGEKVYVIGEVVKGRGETKYV
ncbi:MAG TPA: phosphoribosylformylglycinamidine cyclo-ligase [Anaerolineae bacterium]|jgi:phosphoribosylformylglycinamidine cyclo-ligase|nr:phosphoribosylformylglycinamidine cyclo-ligase [Anaerolineae bacterium]